MIRETRFVNSLSWKGFLSSVNKDLISLSVYVEYLGLLLVSVTSFLGKEVYQREMDFGDCLLILGVYRLYFEESEVDVLTTENYQPSCICFTQLVSGN
ncbi:hypothetical protein AVEN_136939-1 [Araneus ventricosus]|uniref:Uncharacterized protein n=1 Tax=Araneus ventricosus TaxID=182803 RepID=A0A4Y2BJM6_ARAVE|nr:hypothetical protein AVEN_136939-1 [Araneus ventricosus]